MTLQGSHVTLADGRSGQVVAEYHDWLTETGTHHGHRLRVAITSATCEQCPHGGGPVTHYVTVDAESVTI